VRLAAALAETERLRAALARAEADAAKQAAAAHEDGRREGLAAASEADDRRLKAVSDALADARAAWDERLAALDHLALLVARTALSKFFEAGEDLPNLVARTVARQIGTVRRETIVALHVSALDFPDEEALAALADRSGSGAIEIVADPALKSGECRMDLGLGHVELGLQSRWRELSRLLEEMADEEASA
jgi:flagellar biosynthesis/type III secretory pathway protein FliH